jgi:hypothetical protein
MFAFVTTVSAATPNWDITGTWVATHEFGGNNYTHNNNITQAPDGSLTGSGGWDGTQNGSIISLPNTWDLINGSVSDNTVHFDYDYATVETCANLGYVDAVINTDGSMSGTWHDDCGIGGRTGSWYTPAGSAMYLRSAEITSPTFGQNVYGTVNFGAYLNDNDVDSIQWAVRQGTCAVNTNTVFGNVDGFSDIATINTGDLSNQTFSFKGDMSTMALGMYCFIYNPVESVGESDIRLTLEFNLIKAPATLPTNKDQCKKDGWKVFGVFKNQGDCVSYVATGGKNPPALLPR